MIEKVDWESAINIRRSIRSYEMREVDDKTKSNLENFISDMKAPFKHDVTISFFKEDSNKRLYTGFESPPDGMAFIADTDIPSISTAGFVGEMAILYATSLGLATCWYGHYSLEELERILPHLKINNTCQNQNGAMEKV